MITLANLDPYKTYIYRVGRPGENDVIWGEWKQSTFYIYRRMGDLPKSRRKKTKLWKSNSILSLTPDGEVCAEFSELDYCGNGVFCCESWYLEIKGLK